MQHPRAHAPQSCGYYYLDKNVGTGWDVAAVSRVAIRHLPNPGRRREHCRMQAHVRLHGHGIRMPGADWATCCCRQRWGSRRCCAPGWPQRLANPAHARALCRSLMWLPTTRAHAAAATRSPATRSGSKTDTARALVRICRGCRQDLRLRAFKPDSRGHSNRHQAWCMLGCKDACDFLGSMCDSFSCNPPAHGVTTPSSACTHPALADRKSVCYDSSKSVVVMVTDTW